MRLKKAASLLLVLTMVMLGACGAGGDSKELSQTINTPDESFTFHVPADWSVHSTTPEENFVMSISKQNTASANIFFYENESDGLTAQDYVDVIKEYYGENIIGEVGTVEAGELAGYYFEYSMVDLSEEQEECNYHGYEYVYDAKGGIVEIDISYSQTKLEGKLFDPSEENLNLLRSIAESIEQK